jgi:hypothetical protein
VYKNLLKKLAIQLTKSNIPYMIIGGQAVLFYGEPRFTRDIDITLGIGIDELYKIKQVINKLNLTVKVKNYKKFAEQTMVIPTIDKKTGIGVDFVFSYTGYERQAIKKAKDVKFGKTNVKVASLEDVIIHKVIAGRPRDIEDIIIMLIKNPNYDVKYINRWLKEFDITLNKNLQATFKNIIKFL